MRRSWFFLFLLVFSMPVNAVQIVEFCPDPYLAGDMDEYIVLSGSGNLDGVLVSDGEGGFRFPQGSTIEGQITIARSGLAFQRPTIAAQVLNGTIIRRLSLMLSGEAPSSWQIPVISSEYMTVGHLSRNLSGPGTFPHVRVRSITMKTESGTGGY